MTAANDLYLGVEIGATKQQVALSDAAGDLLCTVSEKVPLPNGAADVQDWLLRQVPLLVGREAEFGGKVRAIGAGFGGVLESRTGRIRISVQVPGWQDFPLAGLAGADLPTCPPLVANDTVAGGYAELCRGSGVDARHFFYSNIGSGIGGALFLDRVPYDGLGMGSAYLGHTYVPDWTSEAAGRENKLENLCSGWSIERRLRTPGYVARESELMAMCRGEVSVAHLRNVGRSGPRRRRVRRGRDRPDCPVVRHRPQQPDHARLAGRGGHRRRRGQPRRRAARSHPPLHGRAGIHLRPGGVPHRALRLHGRGGAGRRRVAGQGSRGISVQPAIYW